MSTIGRKLTYDDYVCFPDDGMRHEVIDVAVTDEVDWKNACCVIGHPGDALFRTENPVCLTRALDQELIVLDLTICC